MCYGTAPGAAAPGALHVQEHQGRLPVPSATTLRRLLLQPAEMVCVSELTPQGV
jgi:hypothetical protein